MMPPGHIATTWAVFSQQKQTDLDYRWLAASSLLPDIIDKPLALWIFTKSHSSQNLCHALLPNLLFLLVAIVRWPKAVPYVLAFNGHLLADRMWRHTETFWWPFYGWQTFWQFKYMNSPKAMVEVYIDIIRNYPRVWIIELLAILYLAWFGKKYRLYIGATLREFLQTGRLP
ncbi:MAG: metal-dependent hydrolase [Chloroflexota bacterium]